MKLLGRISRVLIGALGLVLTYATVVEVVAVWQANPWAEYDPLQAFFRRSMVVSIPAIPIGLVLAALRPNLWPLPLAALIWTSSAAVLIEPQEFDFVLEWLLQFSSLE